MKKSYLLFGALVAAAAVPEVNATEFGGPYVGASAGFANTRLKLKEGDILSKDRLSGNGFDGRVLAGWGTTRGNFYMGAEAGLGYLSSKPAKDRTLTGTDVDAVRAYENNITLADFQTRYGMPTSVLGGSNVAKSRYELKSGFVVSPALLAGAVVSDKVLVYGRLGFDFNWRKEKISYTVAGTVYSNTQSVTNYSLVPGIGADYMVNDRMKVGAFFNYALQLNKGKNQDALAKKTTNMDCWY